MVVPTVNPSTQESKVGKSPVPQACHFRCPAGQNFSVAKIRKCRASGRGPINTYSLSRPLRSKFNSCFRQRLAVPQLHLGTILRTRRRRLKTPGLGEAVPGRPPLRRGPPDRLQPEPTAGRGLAAGHKQPLASPPPRPGPPQAQACRRRGACALLRPARSPRPRARDRDAEPSPTGRGRLPLPFSRPRHRAQPQGRSPGHTRPRAAAAQRAPRRSPRPHPRSFRGVSPPLPGARLPAAGLGAPAAPSPLALARACTRAGGWVGARLPRMLSNCPLSLPASFPRPSAV
ncbi:translation initiation factor IF-2-like [Psammomys obesus]|uniref:translation initiation factor IF-2-like n=1 Tax=Psammomys obesus TaxID=48139 RepID=UPI002452F727|nr:translation initiation factor IF-2-like [Psammomys obesus]